MTGNLQPLVNNQRIVRDDGTPTDYFIRWAQQKQIDISGGITAAQAEDLIAAAVADLVHNSRKINSGTGLSGGGDLTADRTIKLADTVVAPGAYGDATHVGQFTVDQQGRITAAANVAISGGGGGGGWALLATINLAGLTFAEVKSVITAAHVNYVFEFFDVLPGTIATHIGAQLSVNNGTTYDTGNNYDNAGFQYGSGGFTSTLSGAGVACWDIGWDMSATAALASHSVEAKIFNPLGTTYFKNFMFQELSFSSDGNSYARGGGGRWKNLGAFNALRFFCANNSRVQTGNFVTGTLRVWGI